jgi:hypothetical protein
MLRGIVVGVLTAPAAVAGLLRHYEDRVDEDLKALE